MLLAHRSLMRPQQPPLQKRSHALHTGHQFVRRVVALADDRDLVSVALLGDVVIALPSVRVNHRPRGDRFFNEWVQTLARGVGHPSQPDSADPPPVLLGRGDNDRLLFGLPAADAFFLATGVGFIRLHTAVEPIPAGPDHRTPQLVEPTPSCLVAAQAEHLLKPQRTPSGFLARPGTTSPETTLAGAFASVQKSSPPSERFGASTFYTSGGRCSSARPRCRHIAGIGSSRATEPAAETPDTPLPTRTNRRTPAGFWDSQRRQ